MHVPVGAVSEEEPPLPLSEEEPPKEEPPEEEPPEEEPTPQLASELHTDSYASM